MNKKHQLPVLYSFRRCPYAMRARLGLVSSQTMVELREIVLRAKPAHMLAISPKGTVPVLLLPDGTVVDESLDIMLWALGNNDPQQLLTPQQGSREDMLDLIGAMDGDFKHHLDRFKYATRYEDAAPQVHYTKAIAELGKLDERLKKTPYLFGQRLSLADQALFPFVRQFANADKQAFATHAPQRVQDWLSQRLESTAFKTVFGQKWALWEPESEPVHFP
ncbi:glutathione S-transferase [Flexibacterium corallicola]|uniref:glutathione S-transferase n=1 Tax=Flexibacterium corallicola TaxID=3037259 RepID=UPI00286EB695|nr:glutathione S-transferase [Pseudovibrio sp. M1P-2-3]